MTTIPLPLYPRIEIKDILPASTILFYGGNKLTELVGNKLYKHPFFPPAFHAAFYIENGLFLNVGKFKVVQDLEKEFKSTRRIDIINYELPRELRSKLCKAAYLDATKPKIGLSLSDYDGLKGYAGFGYRLLMSKLGFKIKAKENKKDFCSDNVVDLFSIYDIQVSDLSSEETAPWDLLEYAIANKCCVYTLFVGDDYGR